MIKKESFKIPKSLMIGNKRFRIYEVEKIEDFFQSIKNFLIAKTTIGQIQHYDKKIFIRKRDGNKKETLFHEIAHGIAFQLGKEYPEMIELNKKEKFIDSFAKKLIRTFDLKK